MALALPLLVAVMVLVALARLLPRIRLWRAGAPARVHWVAGLLAVPRRYLVDVHHVVARDPYAARMHALVAGGLLAGSGLALLALVPPLGGSRLWWGFAALAFAAMLAGGLAVGARRYPAKPKRLSGGAFQVLPFLLLGYALGGTLAAGALALAQPAPVGWAGVAIAAAGGLGLAWSTGGGPMRHAITGALHLAAHPRPERFAGRTDAALRPLDLDAPKLGAETPADFAWNRLLAFDSCIQCGRCETACPAFAAGQPLNPKRLVQDLAAAMTPGGNPAYAGSPYPNAPDTAGASGMARPVIGADALIHPDTLWSCTTCRACVAECPMMIEHVDAVVDLRRFQTLHLGAPERAETVLAEVRGADEPGGRPLTERADALAGLGVPVLGEGEETDILLWLGTNAYDPRTGRTLRALVQVLQAAGVRFAVLGEAERDCGDLARRLGDEASFQRLARLNVETLGRRHFGRILTADPHSLHTLRNEYPAFGGHFEVVHHSAFLDELAASGRLRLRTLGPEPVTFHDPCYLGRYNGETEAPRRLLDRLGLERREMARSGTRSFCCGGGGGAPVTDVAGERRIPDLRMAQAKETGAALVAAACPQCTAMLEGVVGERPDVLDLAELVWRALDTAPLAAPERAREPA